MFIPKIVIISLIVFLGTGQVFMKYDQFNESIELFKFFHDLNDGYFVDIGGFDPMTFSNTLSLYCRGWVGINVEASPVRYGRFLLARQQDLNLNVAIGQNLTFLTLYDSIGGEASATVNPDVKDTLVKRGFGIMKTEVPTLTMKQLCHRYYRKKPNYMNIDIEGFSSFALLGNDWTDIKCQPQILTVQINHSFNDSQIQSPQQILKQHGYKFHMKQDVSEIWIEGSVYDKYMKKYETGTQVIKKYFPSPAEWSMGAIYKHFGYKPRQFSDQTDVNKEPFYIYFPKENSKIFLDELHRQSNLFAQVKDRPILIINYNATNTAIVVNQSQTIISKLTANTFPFNNLTVLKDGKKKYEVYVTYDPIKIEYLIDKATLESKNNAQVSTPAPVTAPVPTTAPSAPAPNLLPKIQQSLDEMDQKIETNMNKNYKNLKEKIDNVDNSIDKIGGRIDESLKERLTASDRVKSIMGTINGKMETIQQSLTKLQKSTSETQTKVSSPQKDPELQNIKQKLNQINVLFAQLAKSNNKPDNSESVVTYVIVISLFAILATSCVLLFTLNRKQFGRRSLEDPDYMNIKSQTDKMHEDK